MASAGMEPWRSAAHRDPDPPIWDSRRMEMALRQAANARVGTDRLLWCGAVLSRGVCAAPGDVRAALCRHPLLLPALRQLRALGDRPRCHAFKVCTALLGNDAAADEALVMDAEVLADLTQSLRVPSAALREAAAVLARRVSELTALSPVLVFGGDLLDALLDALDARDAPRAAAHALRALVNLSGHPRLHFCMARDRRVVQRAVDHLSRVSASHSAQCAAAASLWAMVLANLLAFAENRAAVRRLCPNLLAALEVCDAQRFSYRLAEAARAAVEFLHEDDDAMEEQLREHLACA